MVPDPVLDAVGTGPGGVVGHTRLLEERMDEVDLPGGGGGEVGEVATDRTDTTDTNR